MMTNNPNANLIEAMKEKLPLKGQLADMLMDTLYIGKEAVYRRLRGEVPFTLQESALISRKLGISLDKIIGLSFKSNAMFNINIVDYDDPFESYYNILEKYVSLINTMPDDPNSVMGTSANIIPQTLYLKHELLAKFRLFKWMYQNKYIDCKSFEELDIPPKLVNIQKDYVAMTRHIHSIDYIWDNMIFQHLINDIQYFASIHLISDETKEEIKNELFLLADELEELAINGKTADGNRVRIYVSNINFEATYSYVDTNNLQMSLIRIYSINSITTMDNEIFCTLKEWIQSLKKFSTLISESGNPDFVVLDEPTNGLDPNQIVEIRELIREIAVDRTVILSTHILSEVQATCDYIRMIEEGQVVFAGTVDEFDNYIVPNTLFVSLIAAPPVEMIRKIPGVVAVEELGGSKFRIQFSDALEATERLVEASVTKGWRLVEIRQEKSSLDEIFAELSKK